MIRASNRLREWKIVLLILAVLLIVFAPHLFGATKNALAARIVCDFNTIIKASMSAYAENDEFPATCEWGELPEDLAYHLPRNFTFAFEGVEYRWRNWDVPSGLPSDASKKVLVGLQVRTNDADLIARIVDLYRGRLTQLKENQVTLVIL